MTGAGWVPRFIAHRPALGRAARAWPKGSPTGLPRHSTRALQASRTEGEGVRASSPGKPVLLPHLSLPDRHHWPKSRPNGVTSRTHCPTRIGSSCLTSLQTSVTSHPSCTDSPILHRQRTHSFSWSSAALTCPSPAGMTRPITKTHHQCSPCLLSTPSAVPAQLHVAGDTPSRCGFSELGLQPRTGPQSFLPA